MRLKWLCVRIRAWEIGYLGDINDEKKFTHSLEIASGSVTLEMPRIAKDCHTAFRYYFRATVVFKSGLVVASSYRIPLK
jgi:hypothetical protein